MLLIFGGSFNPPTVAHAAIAKKLVDKYKCDFIFVPVGDSYGKKGLISFEHRYNMVKIIADKLNVEVSDIENNEEYLGTYTLLKTFKRDDIHFIMGADNMVELNTWFDSEKLISEFKFIIITRGDNVFDLNNYSHPENFEIINSRHNISSSLYRKEKNNALLDEDVLKYIQKNNLYEGDE